MKRQFASPNQSHLDVDLLSAYIDGHVTSAEREHVENHLRGCAACRVEYDSMKSTVALLAALPRVPVPRALTLSEAQVGIRRPAAQPSWYGGLLRGLGAVTALALVAVIAVTLMRPPASTPVSTMARSAATATEALSETAPSAEPAAQPMQAAPEATALQQPTQAAALEEAQPQAESPTAPEATATDATAEQPVPAPMAAVPEPETTSTEQAESPAPVEDAARKAESAADTTAESSPAAAAMAAEAAQGTGAPEAATMAANAEPTPQTESMAMMSTAPPESAGTPSSKATGAAAAGAEGGRGGGGVGGAAAAAMAAPEALTPEAAPPMAPLNQSMPERVRVAFTDLKSLWALDRNAGQRELFKGETVVTPVISSDSAWVAYRVLTGNYGQVWVVRWDGRPPKQLLDEKTLPKNDLGPNYSERRIQDVRWIPGKAALAVNLVAVPVGDALPRTELWQVDVESGALTFITDMGRSFRPFYTRDGTRFALLEYGTEADPKGSLRLFSADGREKHTALEFPASPAKPSYDTQIAWQPDGRSIWLALPDADPTGPTAAADMNSTTIYRVPVSGLAEVAGRADAFQVAWSPDASKLAYTKYVADSMETSELYLAAADGTQPQLYGTIMNGNFLNWSPDGAHFLYQDNYQVYAGGVGQKPQRLGNAASVYDPRWVSNNQLISRHDTGTGWLLTLRGLDGTAQGLLLLPREVELDVARR